jgi:2-oxoglutarate ferredoxin oxidoreductase subunit gamma
MLKHQEIRIAGMGGQGIMVIGQLLAHATLIEGGNVVWFPSYGPETRGGFAECTVIVSSEEIGSPVTSTPDSLIAMTQPLLDKFASTVKPGGVIFVNTSLAEAPRYREDCEIVEIPANDLATEIGNAKAANMIMLGAYVEMLKPVKLESIKASMEEVLPEHNRRFIPANNAALDKGAELMCR